MNIRLRPSDIWVEIGKIIYYSSHGGEYQPPRRHCFVCSQGVGTTLEQMLNKPGALKAKARTPASSCAGFVSNSLSPAGTVALIGADRPGYERVIGNDRNGQRRKCWN